MEENNYQKGYGKRPLWQWILIYIAIGAVSYALIYYIFFAKNGGYNNPSQYQNQPSSANTNQTQTMKIEILQQGTGAQAKTGDQVTVNYMGTLESGAQFDSSLTPGRTPFQFTLGQNGVIQGWELGVLGMQAGEKRKLTIPPELGYGAQGYPPVIPP